MNLLVIFEAMMQERNVSRVGEKLFLGQPAVSSALARLRAMFADPLFVRNGRYMEPTARAQDLFERFTPMLDTIAITLSQVSDFDPANSSRTFHVGLSDCTRISGLLVNGAISVGISHTCDLPANSKRKFLRLIIPMVLRADSEAKRLSLDEFCRRPHATISSMGTLVTDVERAFKKMSRNRLVVLDVPQFSALAVLLADSDLLAVVPDYVAKAMSACSGIRAEPVPLKMGSYELSLVWRAVADNDPAERWLRSRFSEFFGDNSRLRLADPIGNPTDRSSLA
jgi:LysR family transcriptional activator of mexEF-oprN operon